jgi:hypothetical protein
MVALVVPPTDLLLLALWYLVITEVYVHCPNLVMRNLSYYHYQGISFVLFVKLRSSQITMQFCPALRSTVGNPLMSRGAFKMGFVMFRRMVPRVTEYRRILSKKIQHK